MDWKQEARRLFSVPKPAHFTNYQHCCECAEHDQTLINCDVDSIGVEQLGNPGWDPLCFCSEEGFIYYMPALVRLTLDTIADPQRTYLDQMLFHLIHDGKDNRIVKACSREQREFVARFLEYLVEQYSDEIEATLCYDDDVLKAHDIWSC